eukprot:g22963.t1
MLCLFGAPLENHQRRRCITQRTARVSHPVPMNGLQQSLRQFKRARLPFGLNWARAPTREDGWCAACEWCWR